MVTKSSSNINQIFTSPRRLDVFYVDLGAGSGSIQGGIRPCVIISNDKANQFSPVVHIAPITSKMSKRNLPTHITVEGKGGLLKKSVVLLEQAMLINKDQLKDCLGTLKDLELEINKRIMLQMGVAM